MILLSFREVCNFSFCLPSEIGINHVSSIPDGVSSIRSSTFIHGKQSTVECHHVFCTIISDFTVCHSSDT